MVESNEINVNISIPFPSMETAILVKEVLNVDKELKGSGVKRDISSLENILHISFHGSNLKKIRVSVNSLLRNILLIAKTVEQFDN